MDRQAMADKALSLVGCGYIYGATGWVCTEKRLLQQAKQYPEQEKNILVKGRKWLGKACYDCAQLTLAAARAGGLSLRSGSNTQWNMSVWARKGEIGSIPEGPGIFVFRYGLINKEKKTYGMTHVGVTIGDGTVVEARGVDDGVVRRPLFAGNWTHWADAAEDGKGAETVNRPTLRKGNKSERVAEMQELLMEAGYGLPLYGADGHFGEETRQAVKAFQMAQGLNADGICGPLTWTALLSAAPKESGYEVVIRGTAGPLTQEQAANLQDEFQRAGYAVEARSV